jgi:hypothetical protein
MADTTQIQEISNEIMFPLFHQRNFNAISDTFVVIVTSKYIHQAPQCKHFTLFSLLFQTFNTSLYI